MKQRNPPDEIISNIRLGVTMGSVMKWRKKRMNKKHHKRMLKKTRRVRLHK